MRFGPNQNHIRRTGLERSMGRLMRGPEHPADEGEMEDTGDELDTTAALAEISSDLFGQEDGEDEGKEKSPVEQEGSPEPTVETPPVHEEVIPPTEENTEAVAETGAPKTWTKEAIAEWATVPPRVQQEILKREQDMFNGLEQYREAATLGKSYDAVVEPYRAALAAESINPVELFQNFAGNHYILSRGTPEQKVALFKNFATFYQIDPLDLLEDPNAPQPDPKLQALEARLSTFEQQEQARQQTAQKEQLASLTAEVDAFGSDPKNIYFQEVADDIARLLKTGVASTLKDAYDQAVYLNPVTRGKEVARLTAEATAKTTTENAERVAAANRAKAANVNARPKTVTGTGPVGTMEDTLNETLAAITARG